MENDFEDSLPSLLAALNSVLKSNTKITEDTLKMRKVSGNSKIESRNPYESIALLDFSMVSAAFKYSRYQKDGKNACFGASSLLNTMWDNSCALIKETDDVHPTDSDSDLERTLSSIQMDTDLVSEWSKFHPDFLSLCNLFDEQLESIDVPIPENKMAENEFSNPAAVANFEIMNSDYSKSFDNDSRESGRPESSAESFETRSAVSKSSLSSGQPFSNIGEENSIFHSESYFPEELDYEPSEIGETETKEESDDEFCRSFKEEESISNDSPELEFPENPTFQKELESPTEIHSDQMSFYQSNLETVSSSKSRLKNDYKRCLQYEEEEDSDSDEEHSFKRSSNRNKQLNSEPQQQSLMKSDVIKVSQLNSINEVMLYICEQCKSGNINEALTVANKYITISVEAVQVKIFKELFINVIDWIKNSVLSDDDTSISQNLDEVMKIFHQSKLFDSKLCSLIIRECLGCDYATKTGLELFSFVQKMKVPIDNIVISSYVDCVKLEEIPSLELISFMEYVKCICNLTCPKTILCEVLARFSKQEKISLSIAFFRLSSFLCLVSSREVDVHQLQNFIEFCIKNECWTQIVNFFRAWHKDGQLISCLAQSFLIWPEDVGLFYKQVAEEIYRHEDVSLSLERVLGQIGAFLMLETFSKKQYEVAFEVLFTLHKHNVNYFELQSCSYSVLSYLQSLPEFTDIFVFPFTVAFAALDICLHLKRFRDAYHVFKSFSLNLPGDMERKMKLKVRSRRLGYFLKLTQELHSIEPLKLGLQSFRGFCLEAKDLSLEELEDFTKEIQVIYNKYLISVINGSHLHTALELFEYSEGETKEIFKVSPQVLRGLLVMFAQRNKTDEAYKFFSLGCVRKIYNMEQTKTEDFIWCLTVMSSWAYVEAELVIKTFIENICLAWNGVGTVKILIKESEEDCLEIDCLKKSRSTDSAKEISCKVLKSLDCNLKWIENPNPLSLELVPNTIYDYWIKMKNSFEDVRPKTEFKFPLSGEDFGSKHSTESKSVKPSSKALGQLTPEYSVADSSLQQSSDQATHLLLTPGDKFADHTVSRSIDQEQIISSSNQLSPDVPHSSNAMDDTKVSEIGVSVIQETSEKTDCKDTEVFESFGQFTSKKRVAKTSKPRKKFRVLCLKKKGKKNCCHASASKKEVKLPLKTEEQSISETENLLRVSKPKVIENFQITAQDGGSRMVNHVSKEKATEPENDLKVPETEFQKIVLFLQSKILLKCKDLQPQQQRERARHLASLFIQSNAVGGLDKRTMKLLSQFAQSHL